jgi:hypothetical protein
MELKPGILVARVPWLVFTKSNGNADQHAKNGYAVVKHRYASSGQYLVHATRDHTAEDWLHVRVK